MTGEIYYSPRAEQQLNELDDWISKAASPLVAQRFVSAVLKHIEGIRLLPYAGRPHDLIRQGLRTTTFRKRTLIAYVVEETAAGVVVTVLGVFHGGQDWEAAMRSEAEGL